MYIRTFQVQTPSYLNIVCDVCMYEHTCTPHEGTCVLVHTTTQMSMISIIGNSKNSLTHLQQKIWAIPHWKPKKTPIKTIKMIELLKVHHYLHRVKKDPFINMYNKMVLSQSPWLIDNYLWSWTDSKKLWTRLWKQL